MAERIIPAGDAYGSPPRTDDMAEHAAAGQGELRGRLRVALVIIVACQLMVVLDATIVNIALPRIQASLGVSSADLSWVVNAYTLAFGGLLPLGGRTGDILGRRRVFVAGVSLFTVASLLGGFATSGTWLLAARAGQGVGAAFAAPGALALLMTTFRHGAQRARALGVYAATSASGMMIGLILGGVLTAWASWRWVFFINVPIGAAIVVLAPAFLDESQRRPGRFDLSGALVSTVGLVSLVYGFIRAASNGWRDHVTVGAFAVAAVLLALFIVIETRAVQPITPLHLFADRTRASTYLARMLHSLRHTRPDDHSAGPAGWREAGHGDRCGRHNRWDGVAGSDLGHQHVHIWSARTQRPRRSGRWHPVRCDDLRRAVPGAA